MIPVAKNKEPKIKLNLKDKNIAKLDPVFGTAYALNKWTEIWPELKAQYNQYTKAQYGTSYSVSNFGILSKWGPVDAQIKDGENQINWQIRPKLSNYLRVQDIMILQIIEDAIKDRPIYFAVTVAPNNRMGLDNYLEMEGLVYRVTFEESPEKTSMPRLNYDRMVQNITEAPDSSQKIVDPDDYWNHINAGKGIYRYTNLDNGDVYFNENIQRLIQNYRSSFLQLARWDLFDEKFTDCNKTGSICKGSPFWKPDSGNGTWDEGEVFIDTNDNGKWDKRDYEKVLNILYKMDEYFPQDVIPVTDAELDIYIGNIYKQAGKPEEFKKRLDQISKRKDLQNIIWEKKDQVQKGEDLTLESKIYIGQIYMDEIEDANAGIEYYQKLYDEYPYIPDILYTLVQAYAQADRRSEAVELLELWLRSHPNDSQAIDWLSILTPPTQ